MASPKGPPPPDTQGGPESVLPGQRSGEGSADLWKHVERDEQRKAGHGASRRKKPGSGEELPEPVPPPPD